MGWTNKNKRLSFKMPLYTRIKCDIIPFAFTANINSFLFGIFHIFSVIIHHIGFLADKVHVSPLHIVISGIYDLQIEWVRMATAVINTAAANENMKMVLPSSIISNQLTVSPSCHLFFGEMKTHCPQNFLDLIKTYATKVWDE